MLMTMAPPEGGSPPIESLLNDLWRTWWEESRPGWADRGWWAMPVRVEVARLLTVPAGPDLLTALQDIAPGPCPDRHPAEGMPGQPDPGSAPGFPCGCQLALAAAWRAMAAWTAVQAANALVGAVGPEPVILPDAAARPGIVDPSREEVAAALRVGPYSAASAMRRARELSAHPAAAALAQEGLLPLPTVTKVCEAVARLSPADAAQVIEQWCAQVRARAAGARPMNAAAAARAATVLILRAPSHREVRSRARAARRVELLRNDDGTTTLAATLPEEDAQRAYRRLNAIARGLDDPADNRPMDAKRADVLVDLLLGTMLSRSTAVEVQVTISAEVLLGLEDGTGTLAGVGPIPADVARELAADARWRAWLTDAFGAVVATSPTTYRPSASLARLVRARHPECRMVGCRTAAATCDLDHAEPFPRGETTADNLGPLCRRHHVMKTHYDWDLIPEEGIWRTPAGAEYPLAA